MNDDFYKMKPIFMRMVDEVLKYISIPFEIGDIQEKENSLGFLVLSMNIIFPSVYSDLRAFAPNEKTVMAGIVASIEEKENVKKFFNVSDCIVHKGIPGKNRFSFDVRNVNYHDGFGAALTYLVGLYNGPLKNILLGNKWEDIPFDWERYK